jgi:type I restriction enzyme R subunit
VLDFANEAEEIKAAFEPYYETTLLSEATDPNLLYELQTRLCLPTARGSTSERASTLG